MKKLFIFQDGADRDYATEVEAAYRICEKDDHTRRVNLGDLNAKELESWEVDVVISNRLPREWELILRGLQIVSITLDRTGSQVSDINIDYKYVGEDKYFTGEDYSLQKHPEKEDHFQEIFNLIKLLSWDSDFFGYTIAYLSCRHLTETIMYRIDIFIERHQVKLVEYLCNCHDSRSVRVAEENYFMFKDIRLTYQRPLGGDHEVSMQDNIRFGLAEKRHIPRLAEIADKMYSNSRYYFDGRFDTEAIDLFYKNWIEKAVLGTFDDECYCLFDDDEPIGFCTVRYVGEDLAHIGLVGVTKSQAGKGLGKKLLMAVFHRLEVRGVQAVRVVTQGRNYNAQRLYQKAGFLTHATELWYHRWL
ncbi:MAG: GNAT family N-acetyltransferase [Candidatus Marinimicrobia bacterium]|nr:GNAT family N-acetyltransferase [Candidatus Neomarinimicrobiota bacterium]